MTVYDVTGRSTETSTPSAGRPGATMGTLPATRSRSAGSTGGPAVVAGVEFATGDGMTTTVEQPRRLRRPQLPRRAARGQPRCGEYGLPEDFQPFHRITFLDADGNPIAAEAQDGSGSGPDGERVGDLPLLSAITPPCARRSRSTDPAGLYTPGHARRRRDPRRRLRLAGRAPRSTRCCCRWATRRCSSGRCGPRSPCPTYAAWCWWSAPASRTRWPTRSRRTSATARWRSSRAAAPGTPRSGRRCGCLRPRDRGGRDRRGRDPRRRPAAGRRRRSSRRRSPRPASTAARSRSSRLDRAGHADRGRVAAGPGGRADAAGVPGAGPAGGVPPRRRRRVRGHRHRELPGALRRRARSRRCRAARSTSRSPSPRTSRWPRRCADATGSAPESAHRAGQRLEQPDVVGRGDPAGPPAAPPRARPGSARAGRSTRVGEVQRGQRRRAPRPPRAAARSARPRRAGRTRSTVAPTKPSSTCFTVSVTGRTPTTTTVALDARCPRTRR